MNEVTDKIRSLRNEQKLTLKDLSEKTGLSVSFLSQVERGSSSLAITSLKKIADALEVPITDFFESHANYNYVVKTTDQKPFRIEGSTAEYVRLGGEFTGRSLEPLLVTLSPGQPYDKVFSHPGEEFYYVLDGIVLFNVDGKEYIVKAGDSIHFPSHVPHYWENPLDNDAKVLCVLTPVLF
ncbi:quercetin dioxygenase-like cupin family protein/DNA-binding Xre family transcriptional regulator [Evansella vedderi]|uniref:Quercetin dioxygenase-like cupin family protein/DNA-binding Xre family transcriptional regulator n=1 Tax=Evansella vedderi TaxID=38282 RepID=A0ABT9ZT90_9BACI|nr:cupin domain-containing protein [Evansella vedderi]MDQ0253390.1 quercetin dioxygenase-like cupin family protein/DNA-binding Xre family transcriptional regulator [Evansella vedderi]